MAAVDYLNLQDLQASRLHGLRLPLLLVPPILVQPRLAIHQVDHGDDVDILHDPL